MSTRRAEKLRRAGLLRHAELLSKLNNYSELNRFEVDENKGAAPRDPLHVPVGPITRARAKRFKEALNGLIQNTWADVELLKSKISSHEDHGLVNVIKANDWAE
ncbi:hypothetical protein Dsin_028825 [Dipteronia sinensis]|uniref:Uncharacterized protein n=1 Tax=Dipteronia sinensis TaxID=43782 RepID=A0AAE0DUZ3_9ROSI|nr:hypothetical protein Dsin_028825 [Dipteronia sinensis]